MNFKKSIAKKIGDFGEEAAEKFLKNNGYKILDKNYYFKIPEGPNIGEIDIIAKKDDIITFVEVKTLVKNGREQFSAISPEEKVNFLKQKKMIKTAENWLIKNKIPLNSKWQIGVIAIEINQLSKKVKINYFENAIPI